MKLGKRAVPLVIDVQAGFDDVGWGRRNNPQAEESIADLLAASRASGAAVLHVRHDSTCDKGSFRPSTPGNHVKPLAAELPGEAVYRKTVNSAFIGTRLEHDLRAAGVREVFIVGLTTAHCVSTTARMAANLGFRTVVVSDATATFDGVAIDGTRRPAAEVHMAALSDLDGEFAEVVDTATVLEAVRRSGGDAEAERRVDQDAVRSAAPTRVDE